MSKVYKKMAPLRSTYEVDVRNWCEKYKCGLREDLGGKVNPILADPPYIVRGDRKHDLAASNILSSNDTKILAKVVGDVMAPEAHAHAFCDALRFALKDKAFASERREHQASTRECSGECRSESKKSKSVEMPPQFEIEATYSSLIVPLKSVYKQQLQNLQHTSLCSEEHSNLEVKSVMRRGPWSLKLPKPRVLSQKRLISWSPNDLKRKMLLISKQKFLQ